MPNQLIEIGGEKRPVNFGRNFWSEVETLTGMTTAELFRMSDDGKTASQLLSYKNHQIIAFAALKWGLYDPRKGVEPKTDFTLYQVGDWIDNNPEVVMEFLKCLNDSMPKPKNAEAGESPAAA